MFGTQYCGWTGEQLIIASRKAFFRYRANPSRVVFCNVTVAGAQRDCLRRTFHHLARLPRRFLPVRSALPPLISHLEENVGSQLIHNPLAFLGLCAPIRSQIDMCNHMKASPRWGSSWSSRAAGVFLHARVFWQNQSWLAHSQRRNPSSIIIG